MIIDENCSDESITRKRVAILDWASYYAGNGFGDLSMFIMMGTRLDQFDIYKDLHKELFDFHSECLQKHGVTGFKHTPKSYRDAMFFAFSRFIFIGHFWLLEMPAFVEGAWKRKWNDCVDLCLEFFNQAVETGEIKIA